MEDHQTSVDSTDNVLLVRDFMEHVDQPEGKSNFDDSDGSNSDQVHGSDSLFP